MQTSGTRKAHEKTLAQQFKDSMFPASFKALVLAPATGGSDLGERKSFRRARNMT